MRPDILNFYFRSLASIKGVGPKTRENLKRLFNNQERPEPLVKDLLLHLPYNILKRNAEPDLRLTSEGTEIITELDIDKIDARRMGARSIYKIHASNETGDVKLMFFNASKDYIDSNFKVGEKKIIAGKLERYKGEAQIVHPSYIANDIRNIPLNEPIYPLTHGVSNKLIIKLLSQVSNDIPETPEWQDVNFNKMNNFPDFRKAIQQLHKPNDQSDIDINATARKRLAYDELLADQLALAISRRALTKQKGIKIETKNEYIKALLKAVSFKLTNGQKEILREIVNDLKSGNRMFRLLQGDVGSGKTIVAIAAIMEAVEAGYQGAFMLPTEILAKQQYEIISKILEYDFFKQNNIKACLLIGSLKQSEKKKISEEIVAGKFQIVVGTHALFQDSVGFEKLGIVIIDEQHRFGVRQRMELTEKGTHTHALLMSATPIPRTLAMSVYGDLEVSSLMEKPAGRQKIDTRAMSVDKLDEVVEGINRAIKEDNRVYWVCPLIQGNGGEEDLASVEKRFKELKKLFGNKVALVHGKMKTADKDKAVDDFKTGKIKILVATTVIEVGVNVPEATIIVIESAERFGMAQLHQLRGRVGRSDRKSTCILLFGKNIGETARQRMKIMRETDDGFRIAEEDLALRGSGDLIGTKQSGFPEYHFALLPEHKEYLFAARDDVKMILEKEPELISERGKALRTLLYFFEYDIQIKKLRA